MYHFEEQGGEAKAVGWISMSDMFMLCSIVMLGVAVCFALSLKKTGRKLDTVTGEYASFRTANTLAIEGLKERSAQLSTEAGGYKAKAADLDMQLTNLKNQLAETEKQRVTFKDDSAKFKAQGESLATELSTQIMKLNSVQSDFDKYRNVNTAASNELKLELARVTKELDGYKANVTGLNSQLSALDRKLADSERGAASLRNDWEKSKSESDRYAADLVKQNLKMSSDLNKANGELTRLAAELTRVNGALDKANVDLTLASGERANVSAELAKLNAERDHLLTDLNGWKSKLTAMEKAGSDLRHKLSVMEEDKRRAEAKVGDLGGTIAGLTEEIGALKPQVAKLKINLTDANLRIIDLEKLVFEKIDRAKLVVTVTAQDVPKGFTLELFVTDPLSNECGPFSAVIFNEGDEIGVLQQSVDFRSGREGSQKAVFYSMRPVYSRLESGSTYSVKAMIRHNGDSANAQLPRPVIVNCSIDLPNIPGPDAHKVAQLEIAAPGYIKKVRRNGQLSVMSQYKNMWPWEPSYHFERTVCDFRVSGDQLINFRTAKEIFANLPVIQNTGPAVRGPDEQKIDSIRNRSGN